MVDQKYMMHLSQMKAKLCSALQVDLSELDVFFPFLMAAPKYPYPINGSLGLMLG